MNMPDASAFRVIFVDRWERPISGKEKGYATLEDAEAFCCASVTRSLETLHEGQPSFLRVLESYVNHGQRPRVEGASLSAPVSFDDFARLWIREQLFPGWDELQDRLAAAVPEIPRGEFRWIHHGELRRRHRELKLRQAADLENLSLGIELEPMRLDEPSIAQFERHAWEAGKLGLWDLAEKCWPRLGRLVRGRFFAGYSTAERYRADSKWLASQLSEANLSAESVLEMAYAAVERFTADPALLKAVLDHGKHCLQDTVERMEPADDVQWSRDGECGLAADLAWASSRVIDMVLEAALKSDSLEGVMLALEHGANPNAGLLRVERSFREKHTSLSLAMRLSKPEAVELLLKQAGIEAGPIHAAALWRAIREKRDNWVEALCAKGVAFEHDEIPAWIQSMDSQQKAESCGPFSVFFRPQELDMARQLAAELPCVSVDQVSWFYHGNGQGGMWHTVMESLLEADDVGRLERLAGLGLPLKLSRADYAALVHGGAARCLSWLMVRWQVPEEKRAGVLALLHNIPVSVKIELQCRPWGEDAIPFHVELLRDTLHRLVADARQCHRLYELMMIRRPGDVLKYLWVRVVNVPRSVESRCREAAGPEWPAGCLPLVKFDTFFYWAWDDTEPESSTWLTYREGDEFNKTLNNLFEQARQAQDELRNSDDVLIQTELREMEQHTHHLDRQPNPPFEITFPGSTSFTSPRRTSAYYDKLREVVARPDVRIVSLHNDDDYQTLRILCAEQRRRAMATGQPLIDALTIHVLTDGLPFTRGWRPQIVSWQEGLGYGDLFVDGGASRGSEDDETPYTEAGISYSLRLFKMRLFLTHRSVPGGEADWTRSDGRGWVLYEDVRKDQSYAADIAHSIERHSHWTREKD